MRYVIVDDAHKVVNVVEWDGESEWAPPEGHTIVAHETATFGDDLTPGQNTPE